jgi:hypothetical protein
MPQVESRAQSLVVLKVFHCVRWNATGNFLSFLKFCDSGRYKNRGPKKKQGPFLNIVITTLSLLWREFAKLRNDDYLRRVCLSVLLPVVRMEQLGCHWMDFQEFWNLNIFRKSVEKIWLVLKSLAFPALQYFSILFHKWNDFQERKGHWIYILCP